MTRSRSGDVDSRVDRRAQSPEVVEAPELVEVGRVLRPHGIRGELSVESWSEHEGRFAPGARLTLANGRALVLTEARVHHSRLLARFEGIDDRTQADELRGAVLHVLRSEVPPAPPGSYYHFELVGCSVRDRNRGDLGQVEAVVEDGGGVLLRVGGSGGELLVPFVRAFLIEVDVGSRRIEVDLPEGLIEVCASTS